MNDAANDIAANARRLLIIQGVAGLIGVAVLFAAQGGWAAVSTLYGAGISIAVTLLLSWGIKRAEAAAVENPAKSQAILYLGAAQRFIVVLVLFLVGLAALELDPLATVIGFGLAHVAYFLNLRGLGRTN